jgi:hypothetical protein
MDRSFVYPGSIPQDTDVLHASQWAMIAIGYLVQAAIGSNTFADGLACAPTTVASLSVVVGPGVIGQLATVDSGGFGSLPADTNPLMKLGINETSITFALAAPSTAGQSINYLIEGQMQESDTVPVVLPYYNASNPAVPYSGPSNTGTAQNTQRIQRATMQVQAGSSAVTGTQSTPGADSGWVPLWIVTVNNGQTQITSSSIYKAPAAPFLGGKVSQQRVKLTSNLTLYVGAGGNDLNNGLSANTAFLTVQAAANAAVMQYDTNGFGIIINITGSGTFGPLVVSQGLTGGGSISFTCTPGAVALASTTGPAVNVTGCTVYFSNLVFGTSGSGTNGIVVSGGGSVFLTGCWGGSCVNAIYLANYGGSINFSGNNNISGNAPSAIQADGGGSINIPGSAIVNFIGTPAYTQVLFASLGGVITCTSATFTGSATGSKYLCNMGGLISANSSIPGSTAGTTNLGGQYG